MTGDEPTGGRPEGAGTVPSRLRGRVKIKPGRGSQMFYVDGSRSFLRKEVPSLFAVTRTIWTMSSLPCQGAWLAMCQALRPDNQPLIALPETVPECSAMKAEMRK